MQHPRARDEIRIQANLTIKYAFILWSDLPEFARRTECHYILARYERSRTAAAILSVGGGDLWAATAECSAARAIYGKAVQSWRTVIAALPLWRPMSFKRLTIVFFGTGDPKLSP
jgi:hypothetical protein